MKTARQSLDCFHRRCEGCCCVNKKCYWLWYRFTDKRLMEAHRGQSLEWFGMASASNEINAHSACYNFAPEECVPRPEFLISKWNITSRTTRTEKNDLTNQTESLIIIIVDQFLAHFNRSITCAHFIDNNIEPISNYLLRRRNTLNGLAFAWMHQTFSDLIYWLFLGNGKKAASLKHRFNQSHVNAFFIQKQIRLAFFFSVRHFGWNHLNLNGSNLKGWNFEKRPFKHCNCWKRDKYTQKKSFTNLKGQKGKCETEIRLFKMKSNQIGLQIDHRLCA